MSAVTACTGMAHPSVYPPLPSGSQILLCASQVSYSPFHPVNRSRIHMLVSQVPYNHSYQHCSCAYLVPLLRPSIFYLLTGTTWGLPVKYIPHLHTMGGQKIQTLFCPMANDAVHVCLWLEVSLQQLELTPSPALFSLAVRTVTVFQDAHCSCLGDWWLRLPPTVFKKRFNKEDRTNLIGQAQGVFR